MALRFHQAFYLLFRQARLLLSSVRCVPEVAVRSRILSVGFAENSWR